MKEEKAVDVVDVSMLELIRALRYVRVKGFFGKIEIMCADGMMVNFKATTSYDLKEI